MVYGGVTLMQTRSNILQTCKQNTEKSHRFGLTILSSAFKWLKEFHGKVLPCNLCFKQILFSHLSVWHGFFLFHFLADKCHLKNGWYNCYFLQLYEKIRRSEQKYRVALEVLSYHSQSSDDEFQNVKDIGVPDKIVNITQYV